MTVSNHATGNPNARPVTMAPEAAGQLERVAPAPPGQLSYMDSRCGQVKRNGDICVALKVAGHDTCLGHMPRRNRDAS